RAQAFVMRQHEAERPHYVRRDFPQHLALDKRLANQTKMKMFEIAQAAMDQFAGGARRSRGEIALFAKENRPAATGVVACNPATINAPPITTTSKGIDALVPPTDCIWPSREAPALRLVCSWKRAYSEHIVWRKRKKRKRKRISFASKPHASPASDSIGPPVSTTFTSQRWQRLTMAGEGRRSVTRTSISDRCAIRTGAERENLLLSETNTILRACSTMARDISTSRISKSNSVPLGSIAEVPITATSTRNCSICATVTAPTMPPSLWRIVPPVRKTSIALLR